MKIGVFDSGLGGKAVAQSIAKALPDLTIIVREDRDNVPYGNKSSDELFSLVRPILDSMVADGCEVIVVACNTVTTTIIDRLRTVVSVPLVAVEPMVRPAAAQSRSKIIAVCATPATLASERYNFLKQEYANGVTVLEPDCSDWSTMIENSAVDAGIIASRISRVLDEGADIIVLGCTHYHWIESEIRTLAAGRAEVMQPTNALISQLKRVLERLA